MDDDLNKGFARIAKQYNMTVPEVKGFFKNRDDMLPFINELLNEKILQFLRAEAQYVPMTSAAAGEDKESSTAKGVPAEEITDNKETAGE